MCNSKKIKVATIILDNQKFEVEGLRNKEAWEYAREYNESETERLIQKLNQDIRIIDKKLRIRGYFFSDEIGYYDTVPEVIKELLNRCFNKSVNCGMYMNDILRVIFFDVSCKNINGIYFDPKQKFDEHYNLNNN